MKKFNLLLITLGILAFILAACGNNDNGNKAENANSGDTEANETAEWEYEPEDIDPEVDVCVVCGMAIADDQYATQIILKNEQAVKFDDLGDLHVWVEENGEDDIGAKFVRDFNTHEWILLEDATYVSGEEIGTPMGFGVISFKNKEDAENYIEENGHGELLSAADLADHVWEMDHDHHHGDHDHDHEHGFHTEGFDMQMTELEGVSVEEEIELEVNITLDEDALEDARVRYEVWLEDDKDSTDWVDASENNAGIYTADYAFAEVGTYHIQIHVEDNEDLHEHLEYEVNVKE